MHISFGVFGRFAISLLLAGAALGGKLSARRISIRRLNIWIRYSVVDWRSIGHAVAMLPLLIIQLLGLWGLNFAGIWVVEAIHLPIPGNLIGMLGLYVLLSLGLVKVSWFETTGAFLIKHLAFFFIPITAGLMDAGDLLAAHGFGIAVTLVVSAAVGILLSGFVAQSLVRRTGHSEER